MRVGFGHIDRGGFVSRVNEPDTGIDKSVVDRKDLTARQGKNQLDAFRFKRPDQQLRAALRIRHLVCLSGLR